MKYTPIKHYHRNLCLMFISGFIIGIISIILWIVGI